MPVPVIIVASGGVPIINTPLGTPMTPVTPPVGGLPIIIVMDGGFPVHLVKDDLADWP
jgi:hypothetical protein